MLNSYYVVGYVTQNHDIISEGQSEQSESKVE